jgi:hypothetical protein
VNNPFAALPILFVSALIIYCLVIVGLVSFLL